MWNLFIETYIHSYMFNLQPPSKYSPFDAIHLSRHFSTVQNSFWTHQFWHLLVLQPFFVSHILHQQNISFWELFSSRETNKQTKKSLRERSGEYRGWGMEFMSHATFDQKLLNTQRGVGRCVVSHPSWNGQRWKSLPKKFTEAKCSLSQQCQLVHWYRWVPKHSPSGGSLYYKGPAFQKIILVYF